jgi:hypothetical protein
MSENKFERMNLCEKKTNRESRKRAYGHKSEIMRERMSENKFERMNLCE